METGRHRPETGSVVALEGVTRRFGQVTAVEGLSLTVGRGETVALLGSNGAGKTTTVEMLLGLLGPDVGRVRLFGGTPAAAVAEGRVGAMLQDAGLPQGVTVTELIELVRGLYRNPMSRKEVLRLADLEEVAGRQVQRLSGGQRQRVRLAMAVAGGPELLVLDEPTAGLDVEARRAFWGRASAYVSEGRVLLFATHRLEEAEAVADRVVVIARGRIVADASPHEVKAQAAGRSAVSFVADGLPPVGLHGLPGVETIEADGRRLTLYTNDPDRTVRALLARIPDLEDLEVTRTGLEEAFLALTREEDS